MSTEETFGQSPTLISALDIAKLVAARLVENAQESFETKESGGVKWPERSVPNIAGILSDLTTGTNVKERRFTAQDVLVDKGILRASPTANVISENEIEVGSFVDYAAKHQLGLSSILQITQTMAINLKEYMKGLKESNETRYKELGFMFGIVKKPSVRINLPERPFWSWDEDDTKAIRRAVKRLAEARSV